MADYVRVPAADWQDICDSVREKIGGEDGLLSGEVAPAVRGVESGGGGIEHTYTVDYTPSINTRALTIPIPGFTQPPVFAMCYAISELPEIAGLQGCIKLSVAGAMGMDLYTTMSYAIGRAITKTQSGMDYWNVFTRVSSTPTECIIDATGQENWEFIAGVTYRFIFVEAV